MYTGFRRNPQDYLGCFNKYRAGRQEIFPGYIPDNLLVLFGKPLLGLLFGSEFEIAYVAMVLLVVGQFANAVSGSTGNFMNMTGHQTVFRNIMTGAALLNISLNLSLIPRFGIDGAAFAGMVSLSLWNVGTLVFIKIRYGKIIGYLPFIPME